MKPSTTISAWAGTSRSLVSQVTTSSGSPRRPPATPNSSPRTRATDVSDTGGSHPITTAQGVGLPCFSFFMMCGYMSRQALLRKMPYFRGPFCISRYVPTLRSPVSGSIETTHGAVT